jgi:AsmA protein
MKKKLALLLKIFAVFFALFLAALAAAPFLLEKYLPSEKVRNLIVSQAQKSLRREVKLGGISWGLLRGLSIKELAISEFPDFKAGTFSSMRHFSLQIQWLPLLRRKVMLDTIALEGLNLSIVKSTDGLYNFSDLAGSTSAAPGPGAAAAGAAGMAMEFDFNHAQISDARINYKDLGTRDFMELSELEAKVRHFRLDRPFPAEVSLKAAGKLRGRIINAGLLYSGKINPGGGKSERMALEIKKMLLSYGGLRLQLSGLVKSFTSPKVKLKASLASKKTEIFEGEIRGQGKLAGPNVLPTLKADFDIRTPGFTAAQLRALGAPLDLLGVPEKLEVPALKASGSVDIQETAAEFRDLHLETHLGSVDLSGSVRELSSKK